MPDTLALASSMLGKSEGPDRAAIMDYLTTGGQNLDPATLAWCAAFVNSTLEQAGLPGTGSNMARSFLDWGAGVSGLPQVGDIGVYPRGDPKGPYGHVGFVKAVDPATGMVTLLGGNQGDAVSEKPYPIAEALGFRRSSSPANPNQYALDTAAPADGPKGEEMYPKPAPPLPPPYDVADRPIGAMQPTQVAGVAAPKPKGGKLAGKIGDALAGFGATAFGGGGGGMAPRGAMATPGAARLDAPGEQPTIDPQQAEVQRQQLAMALARLNSGRLA
jgi:uncharacterized protein (TIGR02594 family)